jgi:hypothetical protein
MKRQFLNYATPKTFTKSLHKIKTSPTKKEIKVNTVSLSRKQSYIPFKIINFSANLPFLQLIDIIANYCSQQYE